MVHGENRRTGSFLLIGLGVVVAVVLSVAMLTGTAQAQGDGQAASIVCVVAAPRGNETPIILVDAAEQTIMIYKYTSSGEDLELVTARSYRFDRLIKEYNIDGMTVDDVKKLIKKQEND
jgi:hypothetical protein